MVRNSGNEKRRGVSQSVSGRDCRSTIIEAAIHWIMLNPGGRIFSAGELREYVLGTQKLACLDRGDTPTGSFRFYSDVTAAIRKLEKEQFVRKMGNRWQRTAI